MSKKLSLEELLNVIGQNLDRLNKDIMNMRIQHTRLEAELDRINEVLNEMNKEPEDSENYGAVT